MPLDALPHVTLTYASRMRRYVWDDCPAIPRAADWDHVAKGYPADPAGMCRHKAAWLAQQLGGEVLYGRRTDQEPTPPLHAVLFLRIGDHGVVLDADGTWPWPAFRKRWRPEVHEPTPPPEPKPTPTRGGWYSRKG